MEDIFRSELFYAPENRGNLIKSPVELLVGSIVSVPPLMVTALVAAASKVSVLMIKFEPRVVTRFPPAGVVV